MVETFLTVVTSLAPVFLVIFLGFTLRAGGFIAAQHFDGLNKICYFVIGPAYIVLKIAEAELDFSTLNFLAAGLLAFAAQGMIGLLSFPMARRFADDLDSHKDSGFSGPIYSCIVQSSVRWNGFGLLAIIGALYGTEGVAQLALIFGVAIPFNNLLNVIVLARFGENNATGASRAISAKLILKEVAMNPMIVSSLLGVALNILNVPLTGLPAETLELTGKGALGAILLCVGAGLSFGAVKGVQHVVIWSCFLKLLLAPISFFAAGVLLGVNGLALAVLVAIGATPVAGGAYNLAKEMGGDTALMSAIITLSTVLAAITFPLAITLLAPDLLL